MSNIGIVICPDKKCRAENGSWRNKCRRCRRRLHPTAGPFGMNMPRPGE